MIGTVRQNWSLTVEVEWKEDVRDHRSEYVRLDSRCVTLAEESMFLSEKTKSPTQVSLKLGMTMNMGNFESARVDVGITVPCDHEKHEECYDWSKDFVEERIKTELQKLRGAIESKKSGDE